MKKFLFSLLVCLLVSIQLLEARTELPILAGTARLGGNIAVGPDNLTRVVWYCKSWPWGYAPVPVTYGVVRVDTYSSAGSLIVRGANHGPYSGWSTYPPIAVGRFNDTHLGWLSANTLSTWSLDSSNNYAWSTASAINGSASLKLVNVSMDSSDSIWYNLERTDKSDPIWSEGSLWSFDPLGTALQLFGQQGSERHPGSAVRADGKPLTLVVGADPSILNQPWIDYPVVTNNPFPGAYAYNYLFSNAAVAGWIPTYLTTTPNNRCQIWWRSGNTWSIWDINADGSFRSNSPAYSGTNLQLLSVGACAFGGDGKVRALWYNTSTGQYFLKTYNTSTWAVSSATLTDF